MIRLALFIRGILLSPLSPIGCSLLTSTSDLTGGGGDAGADHAVADAPTSEAAADAAADALVDAPPAPFCSTLSPSPALCEDFDGNNTFDAQFTQTLRGPSNEINADGTAFKSAPRSCFSRINAGANVGRRYAYMFKTFSAPATRVSFGFDILMVDVVNGESAVVAGIIIDDGMPTQHGLTLVASGVDASMEESFAVDGGMHYQDKVLSAFPVAKTWSRVQVDIALSPAATMTVTIDGTQALRDVALDPSWPASGSVQINVGMTYVTSTTGPWLVRYDNVVIDPK